MKDEMNEQEPEVDLELTGEDNIDEPSDDEIESDRNAKIKKLQAKLKACEAEKTEHLDNLQRAKAEFLNARKRLEDEKKREKERQTISHVQKLLPLYDSFTMAMHNTEAWNAVDADWRKGVESIYAQLQKTLTAYGVAEVSPLGEEFDPMQHEAMSEVTVDDAAQDHKIVSVIQKGFTITIEGKTELIRPARVTVGILQD